MSEAGDSVGEFVPSTQIGSYLSQNYNPEVENKKVPGFICGRQTHERTGLVSVAAAAAVRIDQRPFSASAAVRVRVAHFCCSPCVCRRSAPQQSATASTR